MGIFFLTSNLMEAARGQKYPSDAKNGKKESIYWKKVFNKGCWTTPKTPWQVQSDLSYELTGMYPQGDRWDRSQT